MDRLMVQIGSPEYVVADDLTLKCFGRPTIGSALPPRHRVQKLRGASRYVSASAFGAFDVGTARPNWGPTDGGSTNIGCRIPSSQLQQITQATYTPAANSTMQGIELWGELLLPAGGPVHIVDCILHGPDKATYDAGIVRGASRDLRGSFIEWCTLDGTGRESPWTDGVKGGNFTMRYCVVTRSNDGMGWSAPVGNGVIECSRIVNGYYTAWRNSTDGTPLTGYPTSPSDYKSHSDGIQIQGRSGWVVRGNYIGGQPASGWSTSQLLDNRDQAIPAQLAYQKLVDSGLDYQDTCILMQNNIGPTAQVGALVELNWMSGGASSINMNGAGTNGDYLGGVTVRNNRIIRDVRGGNSGGYKLFMADACQAVVTGNVYDDDGTLVAINLYNGGTRAQAS